MLNTIKKQEYVVKRIFEIYLVRNFYSAYIT